MLKICFWYFRNFSSVSVAVSVEGTVMVLLRLDSSTAGGSWNEVTERSGNWLMSGEVGAVTGKGEVADVEASGDGGCMIEALVEAGEVGGDPLDHEMKTAVHFELALMRRADTQY